MRSTVMIGAAVAVMMATGIAMPRTAQARDQQSTTDFVGKWDRDKDQTLDLAEVNRAAATRFTQLDRDKDGTLDKKEAAKAGVARDEFAKFDRDNDGTLDRKEYRAAVEQHFKAADRDKDGSIDEAELGTPEGQALHRFLSPAGAQTASRAHAGQGGAATR